jgi:hypothetical protein
MRAVFLCWRLKGIKLNLSKTGKVTITLFDLTGKQAALIIDKELRSGAYTFNWNRGNLPPGIYSCNLITVNEKNAVN